MKVISKPTFKIYFSAKALVVHACNPNHSGGRDQEGHGLRSAQGNISGNPISKISNTKKG
jgi:hypothetical protein